MGLVINGPARAPIIILEDETACSPTALLYERITGRIAVTGDPDYITFQDGYFGKVVRYSISERLRMIFDSEFRERKNAFARNYNAGLKARRDLEQKIGHYVRL